MDENTAFILLFAIPLAFTPIIYFAGRLSKHYNTPKVSPSHLLSIVALVATVYPPVHSGTVLP